MVQLDRYEDKVFTLDYDTICHYVGAAADHWFLMFTVIFTVLFPSTSSQLFFCFDFLVIIQVLWILKDCNFVIKTCRFFSPCTYGNATIEKKPQQIIFTVVLSLLSGSLMGLVTTRSEPLGHIKTYLQMLYTAGVWIEKLSKKFSPSFLTCTHFTMKRKACQTMMFSMWA